MAEDDSAKSFEPMAKLLSGKMTDLPSCPGGALASLSLERTILLLDFLLVSLLKGL